MIGLTPRLHTIVLLLATTILAIYAFIDLRDGPDKHPDPALIAAVVALATRALEARKGERSRTQRPIQLTGVSRGILRRVGTAVRRWRRNDRHEAAELRRDNAMLTQHLREAENRLKELHGTDRVERASTRLEAVIAQLEAALPTPVPTPPAPPARRRRPSPKEPPHASP